MLEHGKATIYKKNEFFGYIQKVEVRECTIDRGPYAQYRDAIKVTFIKPRCRKTLGFWETYRPHLLILDGHGHPDPADMFDGGEVTRTPNVTAYSAKYSAFDEGYGNDFDELIDAHIKETGATVLIDARGKHIS
ncbi:MAG: hypothetical protein V3S71_02725 [Acidobacteriota bacterium]